MRYGKSNYTALKPFIEATDNNDFHATFTADGFMDLTIEKLYYTDPQGNDVYSISHYDTLNGDLMSDPDIEFSVGQGEINPLSFRNDFMGYMQRVYKEGTADTRAAREIDDFLHLWLKNIKAQGFKPDVLKAN